MFDTLSFGTPETKYPKLPNAACKYEACKIDGTVIERILKSCGAPNINAVYQFTHDVCNDLTISSENVAWTDSKQRTCQYYLNSRTCGNF